MQVKGFGILAVEAIDIVEAVLNNHDYLEDKYVPHWTSRLSDL